MRRGNSIKTVCYSVSLSAIFACRYRANSAKLIALKATSGSPRSPIHHAVALRAIRKEKGFLWWWGRWIICSRACRGCSNFSAPPEHYLFSLRQQSRDECVCAGERDKGEKFPRNSRRSIFLWPERAHLVLLIAGEAAYFKSCSDKFTQRIIRRWWMGTLVCMRPRGKEIKVGGVDPSKRKQDNREGFVFEQSIN